MHFPGALEPINFATKHEEKNKPDLPGVAAQPKARAGPQRCNLFGPADDDEIFQGHGREDGPNAPPAQTAARANGDTREPAEASGASATRALMTILAKRMVNGVTDFWPRPTDGSSQNDNENIPAGYTYLAQFVAHDLVSHIAPVPTLEEGETLTQRDFRSQRLVLDTIYGGGPAQNPTSFAIPDKVGQKQRIHLRLGRVYAHEEGGRATFDPGKVLVDQPARDVPRTACPFLNDQPGLGSPDVLLADPRNDDNLIISQLTAVFHELHNMIVCATLKEKSPGEREPEFNLRVYRHFLLTRKVVALVYRRIVFKDLLYRLLDRKIFERYSAAGDRLPEVAIDRGAFEDTPNSNRVPVEFSHAVFRFAHAIIRDKYTLNDGEGGAGLSAKVADILDRSSGRSTNLTPLSCNWLVDWKHFFETQNGFKPNFSRPIRPDVGGGDLAGNYYFPNEHRVVDGGLFYRDLIRGVEIGVRKVQNLIDKLPDEDRVRSDLLVCSSFREQQISKWLTAGSDIGIEDRDVQTLAKDPPLFFYTLFEAAHDKQGQRLGILGSTIIAEVMFVAFHKTSPLIEQDASVNNIAENYFNGNLPVSMPALLNFMKSNGGLKDVECPKPKNQDDIPISPAPI